MRCCIGRSKLLDVEENKKPISSNNVPRLIRCFKSYGSKLGFNKGDGFDKNYKRFCSSQIENQKNELQLFLNILDSHLIKFKYFSVIVEFLQKNLYILIKRKRVVLGEFQQHQSSKTFLHYVFLALSAYSNSRKGS